MNNKKSGYMLYAFLDTGSREDNDQKPTAVSEAKHISLGGKLLFINVNHESNHTVRHIFRNTTSIWLMSDNLQPRLTQFLLMQVQIRNRILANIYKLERAKERIRERERSPISSG